MPAPVASVWAAKAALREKEREVERKKEESKRAAAASKPAASGAENGGSAKDQHPEGKVRRDTQTHPGLAGAEGELVVADGLNATMWIRVNHEYAGFIVGPEGKVINEIAQQTLAHILSPRKGEDSIFFISGPKSSVVAAAALIRVKELEGKERESAKAGSKVAGSQQETVTDVCAVPESLVGFVMGSQRSVIMNISHQTRAKITCPNRGGKPEFQISGHPVCVSAAKACIDARVQQASIGVWQASNETVQVNVMVGVDKVGLIVGPQGTVIQNIALTTGTTIISPRKGQDPVFVISGPKRNVEVAKQIIESKAAVTNPRPQGKAGKKGRQIRVDAMNRPLIVDGLARGAPP